MEIPHQVGIPCDKLPEKWTSPWNSLVIKPRDPQGLFEDDSKALLFPQGQAFIAAPSAGEKLEYSTTNKAQAMINHNKGSGL